MPIYEYLCSDCDHDFEKKQSFHAEAIAECPKCRAKAKRVFKPVPIIFKGSGFYVTDHREESKPGKTSESKPVKTSESKPVKTSEPKPVKTEEANTQKGK